ncbi:hypothetical protein NKH77_13795 [Streptomyces sp. M19]
MTRSSAPHHHRLQRLARRRGHLRRTQPGRPAPRRPRRQGTARRRGRTHRRAAAAHRARRGEHELRVEADMRYTRTGEGMHRFTDPPTARPTCTPCAAWPTPVRSSPPSTSPT